MSTAGANWNATLDLGESTMIVAKAATQTKMPIPGVEFAWESEDTDIATVDGGMIESVRAGTSKITATALGRGISVNFTVTVLSEVKSVVITAPGDEFYLSNGESVALAASARDAAQDADVAGHEGNDVPVDLTFMSSDDSVIEIDGANANAVGVGSAKITAHYGDIASDAITINVTPGGDVTHQLTYTRIAAADRKFHIAWSDDSTDVAIYGPGDTAPDAPALASSGNGGTNAVYTVQVRIFDSEGNANIDDGADVAANLEARVQGSSIDAVGIEVALTDGIATIIVHNDDGDTQAANNTLVAAATTNAVVGVGVSRIILSYPGADDITLPAITVTEATEAPADE